jgi:hypothetical protein
MTQAAFSNAFGFSIDAVKHWEGDAERQKLPHGHSLRSFLKNPRRLSPRFMAANITVRRLTTPMPNA